ncbi:hypothetical protein GMD59_18760 [Ruthenibacterium lactatiformans]|uniref:Uncharacterized protein n=1 Tax=Ruthenibacterium lactatiformans TaxID=1550024 RepID=A0A6L6LWY3_9FIRM|nr:hypothetical protein [Ruthenibacterium lactatiformans]MTS29296.1 hypothetical protein [Ruthenibacterium lactatiformans]
MKTEQKLRKDKRMDVPPGNIHHLKEILKEIYNFKVLLLANGRIEQER